MCADILIITLAADCRFTGVLACEADVSGWEVPGSACEVGGAGQYQLAPLGDAVFPAKRVAPGGLDCQGVGCGLMQLETPLEPLQRVAAGCSIGCNH